MNDPVNATDPDGREIKVVVGKSSYTYANGALKTKDGDSFSPVKPFERSIVKGLRNLEGMKSVSNFMQKMISSPFIHTITQGPKNKTSPASTLERFDALDGKGVNTTITVSDATSKGESKVEDNQPNTVEATLVHELSHSEDYEQGKFGGKATLATDAKSPTEVKARRVENKVRKEQGLKELTTYDGVKIKG
jgi:hypothetical protein